jgi:hypothetical protein
MSALTIELIPDLPPDASVAIQINSVVIACEPSYGITALHRGNPGAWEALEAKSLSPAYLLIGQEWQEVELSPKLERDIWQKFDFMDKDP